MTYSFSLTQRVNFYISILFILAFGIFMTTTVVNAIDRNASSVKYMSISYELSQQQ